MNAVSLMSDAELEQLAREPSGFGALETARGCLPLTALKVAARVVALTAEVELSQTFVNTLAEPLEATYIFPLPDRAAVNRFQMDVAGRLIEGVIDERGRARANYDQAIAMGQRAAIAEEDRPGVFTLRVGNLMPGEAALVRLTLVGPLPFDEGEATFCFPLVIAPRYIPGVGLPGPQAGTGTAGDTDAVPDASRITPLLLLPGFPNPVELAIDVSVDGGGLPVSALRSSLHAVTTTAAGGVHTLQIQAGERLNRDFILRWRLGDAQIRSTAVMVPDAGGSTATCLITVVPPQEASGTRPRDAVFVLDRSGSMQGWKMVAARRAVARMVDTLAMHDRFAVLAFDDSVDMPDRLARDALSSATDRHRFRAVEFLAGVNARGGTELVEPLATAARLLQDVDASRDRVLILVTDGQVGNEDQILRQLAKQMQQVRVFTLGIDTAVNAAFLRRLAALGGGACELLESEERLDEVMAKVHRRIAQPVLTGLRLQGEGVQIESDSMAPSRLPDLFAGAPLLIAARLHEAASGSIVISGQTPSGRPFSQSVALLPQSGAVAPAIWARARIRDLEDRYLTQPHAPRLLEEQIVAISVRHRVLSRFTAFLAVDRSACLNPDGRPRPLTQPVEVPRGWAAAEISASSGISALVGGSAPPATRAMLGASPAAAAPAPQKAAAPLSAPGAGGMMKKARRQVSKAFADLAQKEGRIDLAPYLRRIGALADDIEASAVRNDRDQLDLLTARLLELMEDVRSVDRNSDWLEELARVAEDLRAALSGTDELAGHGQRAAVKLRRVAQQAAGPTEQTSRAFWK